MMKELKEMIQKQMNKYNAEKSTYTSGRSVRRTSLIEFIAILKEYRIMLE